MQTMIDRLKHPENYWEKILVLDETNQDIADLVGKSEIQFTAKWEQKPFYRFSLIQKIEDFVRWILRWVITLPSNTPPPPSTKKFSADRFADCKENGNWTEGFNNRYTLKGAAGKPFQDHLNAVKAKIQKFSFLPDWERTRLTTHLPKPELEALAAIADEQEVKARINALTKDIAPFRVEDTTKEMREVWAILDGVTEATEIETLRLHVRKFPRFLRSPFLNTLANTPAKDRVTLAGHLAKLATKVRYGDNSGPVVTKVLDEFDPIERTVAVGNLLSAVVSPAFLIKLGEAKKEERAKIVESIALILHEVSDPDAVEVLKAICETPLDDWLSVVTHVASLIPLLPKNKTRSVAVQAMGKVLKEKRPLFVEALTLQLQKLGDDKKNIGTYLLQLLPTLESEEWQLAAPHLVTLFQGLLATTDTRYPSSEKEIFSTLTKRNPKDLLSVVTHVASLVPYLPKDQETRSFAIEAMETVPGKERPLFVEVLLPELQKLGEDKENIAIYVAEFLATLRSDEWKSTVPYVVTLFQGAVEDEKRSLRGVKIPAGEGLSVLEPMASFIPDCSAELRRYWLLVALLAVAKDKRKPLGKLATSVKQIPHNVRIREALQALSLIAEEEDQAKAADSIVYFANKTRIKIPELITGSLGEDVVDLLSRAPTFVTGYSGEEKDLLAILKGLGTFKKEERDTIMALCVNKAAGWIAWYLQKGLGSVLLQMAPTLNTISDEVTQNGILSTISKMDSNQREAAFPTVVSIFSQETTKEQRGAFIALLPLFSSEQLVKASTLIAPLAGKFDATAIKGDIEQIPKGNGRMELLTVKLSKISPSK